MRNRQPRGAGPSTLLIMKQPSILSVFLSDSTLTMPSVSSLHLARELADIGNVPTMYSMPASKAISWGKHSKGSQLKKSP